MTRNDTARRHRRPPGDEPATARSPLRPRTILSVIALVWAAAAAALFIVMGSGDKEGGALFWTLAAVCLVIVLVSMIDLLVIARRTRS